MHYELIIRLSPLARFVVEHPVRDRLIYKKITTYHRKSVIFPLFYHRKNVIFSLLYHRKSVFLHHAVKHPVRDRLMKDLKQ